MFRRRSARLENPIREEEAYARLHGERLGEILSVARVEPPPVVPRHAGLTGERLRRAFETRLDSRAP
jgi:hypothetical protein